MDGQGFGLRLKVRLVERIIAPLPHEWQAPGPATIGASVGALVGALVGASVGAQVKHGSLPSILRHCVFIVLQQPYPEPQ